MKFTEYAHIHISTKEVEYDFLVPRKLDTLKPCENILQLIYTGSLV